MLRKKVTALSLGISLVILGSLSIGSLQADSGSGITAVAGATSINSTSVNGDGSAPPVESQPFINSGQFSVLAANDLGMHCADLDYQIFSILPPFNTIHAQVVRKGQNGNKPQLMDDTHINLVYSATSNPNDPALANPSSTPVYKSNFWADPDGDGRTIGYDTYAPLFFGLLGSKHIKHTDVGLPTPDSMKLRACLDGYLSGTEGPEGPLEKCEPGRQYMPGVLGPYTTNKRIPFDRFDRDVNFFNELLGGLGLGGIIPDTNWWAADGIPILPVDDQGRANSYPLMRVQALNKANGQILASTDVVTPVASEADCQGCHAPEIDCVTATAETGYDFTCNEEGINRTSFNLMTLDGDDNNELPPGATALERLLNVAKINILRVHDAKHGTDIDNSRPVQCATCHYTPALDLAQLGPMDVDGTEQTQHITMSRAMHGHHGELKDDQGNLLFPDMPGPQGRTRGLAKEVLDKTCYQCHPGKRTQCLRGAMETGGVVCQDCHGEMRHVGNDFSEAMSSQNPWPDGANFNKRVPWGSEPGCQSCHTGDALNNLTASAGVPVASDNIRLLEAYTIQAGLDPDGIPDGTEVSVPITAVNKRFAEDQSLYRISKGHGGLMCEGCHGSTHAIFPNANPNANDNVASNQLQGHSGTIVECTTCHETGSLGLTLEGPHGMHPVGDRNWNKEHERITEGNKQACMACHGLAGEGTVLSKTATTRQMVCGGSGTLCQNEDQVITVPKGTEIGCSQCHEDGLNHN